MANDIDTTVGLFFEAGRVIRHKVERSKTSLSPTQLESLRFIYETGSPTMRQLAAHLRVAAPSATSQMRELVGKGYARREHNPADRREVHLAATTRGTKVLQQTIARRKKVLREVLLSFSSRDHKDLQRICQSIITTN